MPIVDVDAQDALHAADLRVDPKGRELGAVRRAIDAASPGIAHEQIPMPRCVNADRVDSLGVDHHARRRGHGGAGRD